MGNFTPLVTRQYEFDGDKVAVKFKRFRREHILKVMPIVQRMNKAQAKKDDVASDEATAELLNTALGLLPIYVEVFEGLRDSDGNAVTIDTVADDMYFIDLATDIIMDCLEESLVMMGGNAKNG